MEPKYIDADALLCEVDGIFRDMATTIYDSQDDALEDAEVSVRQLIHNMPAADVESVKHSRWVPNHPEDPGFYICPECMAVVYAKSNYCPNCGAKMDGGNEE